MQARLLIRAAWIGMMLMVGGPAVAATDSAPAPPAPSGSSPAPASTPSSSKPEKASGEKSAAEKSTSDKSSAVKAGDKAAVTSSEKTQDKATDKPAVEKTATTDKPATDKPAADKDAADKPPVLTATEKPAVPDSAARWSGAPPVLAARNAYETAFEQRRNGDPLGAVSTVENALHAIDVVIAGQPDASVRRDLVDLQSRLAGLKDAARHDLEAPQTKVEPGNEADEKVLNAPAVDDIPLQMNTDVQRWIEFFCGAGRSTFERWLKRSGRYVELFRAVLQREGLPPDLVHLVFVESGFNMNARSVSAAVGPWQFLKGTARLFGLTVDQWVDERKDPEKSTVAAARYLKHLYSIFGDWPLALASYNAGEGAVLRAIKSQGTTNYWDLKLPNQTEQYVPQFMAALAISRNPAGYGFDEVDLDDPMQFDEVALKGAVDLRAVAKLSECSYEDLRALNPAVLRGSARGKDGITVIRVPPGKGEVLREKLANGASLPAVNLTLKHKVMRGETLSGIAAHYSVSAQRLAQVNGIGKRRPLRRGMVLTVPASLSGPAPAALDPGDPRASTAYVPSRTIGRPAAVDGKSTVEGRKTVIVKRGQTLASVAAENKVTVEDIRKWNHLKTSKLRGGMRLKLRDPDAPLVVVTAKDSTSLAHVKLKPRRHGHHASSSGKHAAAPGTAIRVRAGDTLEQIARRNGVSVEALKRVNNLESGRIKTGQKLKVPRG